MPKFESIKFTEEAKEIVEKVSKKIKDIKKKKKDDSATFKNSVVNECVVIGGKKLLEDLRNE